MTSFFGQRMIFKIILGLCLVFTIVRIAKELSHQITTSLPFQPMIKSSQNSARHDGSLQTGGTNDITSLSTFTSLCKQTDLFRLQNFSRPNGPALIPTSTKTFCPRTLTPGSSSLPLTALLSFPGSGNTWVRHILQQLTGIPTGSVGYDPDLLKGGFPFEGKTKNVVAVKTHGAIQPTAPHFIPLHDFDRVILIMRNFSHCILSNHKRLVFKSHTRDKDTLSKDSRWPKHRDKQLNQWRTFMSDTLNYKGPMLIVFYEDLKVDPLPQLIRMADFLSTKEITEFSFCCVMTGLEGKFHRKSNESSAEDFFDETDKRLINRAIDKSIETLPERYTRILERLISYKLHV